MRTIALTEKDKLQPRIRNTLKFTSRREEGRGGRFCHLVKACFVLQVYSKDHRILKAYDYLYSLSSSPYFQRFRPLPPSSLHYVMFSIPCLCSGECTHHSTVQFLPLSLWCSVILQTATHTHTHAHTRARTHTHTHTHTHHNLLSPVAEHTIHLCDKTLRNSEWCIYF